MKREIKFRAWDKKRKEMWNFEDLLLQEKRLTQWMVFHNQAIKSGKRYPEGKVLMQYTGLKDKRGVEVFEGDIVAVGISKKSKDNLNRLVIYDAPTFRLVNKKNEYGNFNLIQDKYNINNAIKLEVIGNIYSNPELLKK